ncbi:MAG: hypothetical protein M3Z84_06990 [Actinomycetota bacterium]|nr:hypothetical protein [Actinomycetota bacterium]
MSVEKLSISLDPELADVIRKAAASEGVSVSMWLAGAAESRARREHLREALDDFASEHGALADSDIRRIISEARARSTVASRNAT